MYRLAASAFVCLVLFQQSPLAQSAAVEVEVRARDVITAFGEEPHRPVTYSAIPCGGDLVDVSIGNLYRGPRFAKNPDQSRPIPYESNPELTTSPEPYRQFYFVLQIRTTQPVSGPLTVKAVCFPPLNGRPESKMMENTGIVQSHQLDIGKSLRCEIALPLPCGPGLENGHYVLRVEVTGPAMFGMSTMILGTTEYKFDVVP